MARQLVRDPYTKLGGVASGIGHHYGIDVSLVRIGFVLITLASGFGLVAYLLSWLIIPRAKYWPPIAPASPIRTLSGREIGLGLIILAFLLALFFTGGTLSQIFVPLVLVGGGAWLLAQPDSGHAEAGNPLRNQRAGGAVGTQPPGSQFGSQFGSQQFATQEYGSPLSSQPVDTVLPDPGQYSGQPATAGAPLKPGEMPRGTPVAASTRRFRRRFWLVPLLVLLVVGPIVLVFPIIGADFSIDFATVELNPTSVDAIPTSIFEEQAELIVDLSDLDPSMFNDGPVPLDIAVEFGRVEVIVPEGLSVSVDARVDVGDLTVFDANKDGFGPELKLEAEGADLLLDISLDVGEVVVRYSDG